MEDDHKASILSISSNDIDSIKTRTYGILFKLKSILIIF